MANTDAKFRIWKTYFFAMLRFYTPWKLRKTLKAYSKVWDNFW